jgi:hypothetical protein
MGSRIQRLVRVIIGSATGIAIATFGLLMSSCGDESRVVTQDERKGVNVVLCFIDGVRHTEGFDDPDHRYVPRMWNDLRLRGAIIPHFRNDGVTATNPGHASVLTGTWQAIANDGSERPTQPTLFEYFRKAGGAAKETTYVLGGKAKLNACSYGGHPEYGAAYGATEAAENADDRTTYERLISVLQTVRPRLVMASFSTVDITAHGNDWSGYLAAIAEVDSLVQGLWNYLQADSAGAVYTQRDICNTVARILDFPVAFSQGVVIEEIFRND